MLRVRPGLRYPRVIQPAVTVIQGLQQIVWRSLDLVDAATGRKKPLTPPRHLMFVGTNQFFLRSDFNLIGEQLMRYLLDVGQLKPQDTVLDVGCGVGRMAAQLTRYIAPESRYDGFDIVSDGIDWCESNITPRFPNFRFQHADIFNTQYNPHGKFKAHEFRFPYPEEHFSFVFLTSVATHVLSPDLQNYLREISRVLTPNGRCFITYFLINRESQQQIDAGNSSLPFRFPVPHGRIQNPETPEAAVAFEESAVRSWYRECGLSVVEPIRYGSWSGRQTNVGYQDVIVATKQ